MQHGTARSALVTGGSRGIGRAICLALARDGLDVAINYNNSAEEAEAVAAEIRALGPRAETFQADMTIESDIERLARDTLQAFGKVDVLVSNAGFGSAVVGRPAVTELQTEQLDLMMRVHLYAPMLLCRALVPQMRALGDGRVIVISSTGVQKMGANMGAYVSAKAALEALAGTLAREERDSGIRVNIVAPGLVATDMGAKLVKRVSGIDDIHELDGKSPFGFVCEPSDVANSVAFLAGDHGRYITGERLTVSGGLF